MGFYEVKKMITIIFTILFLIIFALIVQKISIKFPKFSQQGKAFLEILFWIVIILSIVIPGSYDVWLR